MSKDDSTLAHNFVPRIEDFKTQDGVSIPRSVLRFEKMHMADKSGYTVEALEFSVKGVVFDEEGSLVGSDAVCMFFKFEPFEGAEVEVSKVIPRLLNVNLCEIYGIDEHLNFYRPLEKNVFLFAPMTFSRPSTGEHEWVPDFSTAQLASFDDFNRDVDFSDIEVPDCISSFVPHSSLPERYYPDRLVSRHWSILASRRDDYFLRTELEYQLRLGRD